MAASQVTMKGNRAKQQHHPLRTHYVQARFRMLGAADRPPQPSATQMRAYSIGNGWPWAAGILSSLGAADQRP
jgi:hypothetical protein